MACIFLQRVCAEPIIFTVSRERPIRRADALDSAWENQNQSALAFSGTAQPGEYYVFQIGVFDDAVQPLTADCETMQSASGMATMHCINMTGVGSDGLPFTRQVKTMAERITPLWIAVDFPHDAQGSYRGKITLRAGSLQRHIDVQIAVSGAVLADHGDSVAKNMTRLRWLDSRAGEGDTVLPPYTALNATGNTIHLTGRSVEISAQGVPEKITSTFSNSNQNTDGPARDYLAAPMSLDVQPSNGEVLQWRLAPLVVKDALATWIATGESASLRCEVRGSMDFTGSADVAVTLLAKNAVSIKNLALKTPIRADVARYAVGLSERGGAFRNDIDWKWDLSNRAQDGLWIGDINVGMTMRLRDKTWHRPLVNVYYKFNPLENPTWANGGSGGWSVKRGSDIVESVAYTGAYSLKAGESVTYGAQFFVTPYHVINTEMQWQNRFYHDSGQTNQSELNAKIATINAGPGAPNIYNMHHAGFAAPYINYPMADDNIAVFKDFVSKVHKRGGRARVYYTTRELTANLPELHALHALQGEVILPNGTNPVRGELNKKTPDFLDHNLKEDFVAAWTARIPQNYAGGIDPSVLTVPDGRWDNFYLGGLEWLLKNTGIDGVYIDDTALSARSMQRARRLMLDNGRTPPLVDFHSWHANHGWAKFLPNMVHYADILPYVDCLWMGEGYNANAMPPDQWLVLASGLPFGLMSEMLDGPNPWKGLVFGEVARREQTKSTAVWKAFDKYGMSGTEMILFLDERNPFKTGHSNVLATVYKRAGRSFVAIANWDKKTVRITPQIDWAALSLNPAKAALYAPAMNEIQVEKQWKPGETIEMPPGRGWFLVLDEEARDVKIAREEVSATLVDKITDGFDASVLPQEWIQNEQRPSAAITHDPGAARISIKAPANYYCGLSRALPSGVVSAQATIETNNDRGQDWGPGIALVWENATARIYLRNGDRSLAVSSPQTSESVDGYQMKLPNTLRIVLQAKQILFQCKYGSEWVTVATHARGEDMEGDPQELRVGKMDSRGAWRNDTTKATPENAKNNQLNGGPVGECYIYDVIVKGT